MGENQLEDMRNPDMFRNYYPDNEQYMNDQWNWFIWPRIGEMDLSVVVDVACGHGRNTRKFLEAGKTREVYLVDINPEAIAACQERFSGVTDVQLHFEVTDGTSLASVPDGQASLVYSWDSMVHFDREILRAYFAAFARVLRPGGHGFIHHSNFGNKEGVQDHWRANPGWRSRVTAEEVREYAGENGFTILEQHLLRWNYIDESDCLTVFRKPEEG